MMVRLSLLLDVEDKLAKNKLDYDDELVKRNRSRHNSCTVRLLKQLAKTI